MLEERVEYGEDSSKRALPGERFFAITQDKVLDALPRSGKRGEVRTRLGTLSHDEPQLAPEVALQWVIQEVGEAAADPYLWAHARWDDLHAASTNWWLRALPDGQQQQQLVEERRAIAPDDVTLLVLTQDIAASQNRLAEECASQRARGQQHPEDPDWLYLDLRCDSTSAAIIAAATKFPKHARLALLAARDYVTRSDWQAAVPHWRTVQTSPLFLLVYDDALRALRMGGAPVKLSDAPKGSMWTYRTETREQWARELQAGRIDNALVTLGSTGKKDDVLRLLLAASDGVSDATIQAGLKVRARDINELAFGYALFAREGKDVTAWASAMVEQFGSGSSQLIIEFLTKAQRLAQRPPPRAAAKRATDQVGGVVGGYVADELESLPLGLRGQVYAAALVLAGSAVAPAEWRAQAEGLLFEGERPYFAPKPD